MKKKFIAVSMITAVAGSLVFSSCIGSFNLSRKILAWNQTIDNKFVNEIVFVAMHIVPVYPVSFLADILVINSIEFWSGNNPVEVGIVKQVQGTDGIYTVETLENGYSIQNEKGEQANLVYDKKTNTWSAVANGETTKLIKFEDEGKAIVYLTNGDQRAVDLTTEGVLAFRQSIKNTIYFAQK